MIAKPKGTYDLVDVDAKIYMYMQNVFDHFMMSYHYSYIRTPIFESSELFHRGVGETTDIVTKETYDFKDRGDRNITLRPEGTAGVVRSLIENKLYGNRNDALKYYYLGTMYRYERPQSGRNREFTQFGVEAFNSNDPALDAEVISLGFYLLKEFGIENVTVQINTLGDIESRKQYRDALVEYFKPNISSLCEDCQKRLKTNPLRILDCKVDKDSDILKNAPNILDYLNSESKKRFDELKELLMLLDVDFEINPKIVRGLDYYDHNVWEYVTDDEGITLGGGGRYNSLVENLGGPSIPAVGFALGIERLMIEIKKQINEDTFSENLDVYIMSVNEEEKMHAVALAQDLRLNGIITEMNTSGLSMKSQFKVSDSLHAKFLFILNSDDLNKGIITIKDNATKEEIKMDENDVIDWIIGNL